MRLRDKTLTKYGITVNYPIGTIVYCAVLVIVTLVALIIAAFGFYLEESVRNNSTFNATMFANVIWIISFCSWIIAIARSHGKTGSGILLIFFPIVIGFVVFAMIMAENPISDRLSEKEEYTENDKRVIKQVYSNRIIGITTLINAVLFSAIIYLFFQYKVYLIFR